VDVTRSASQEVLPRDVLDSLPTGRNATTHIVKPALPYLADQDVNEHLCLRAGRKLGLRVAHSEIMQFGNERAIVLRRYDRAQRPDGEVLRIHQEDFCQALGMPPSRNRLIAALML